jgi:hypothetical protein
MHRIAALPQYRTRLLFQWLADIVVDFERARARCAAQ